MSLEKIEKLLWLLQQYDLSTLEVKEKDLEFKASRGSSTAPPVMPSPGGMAASPAASSVLPAHAPADPLAQAEKEVEESQLTKIVSPIVGTFYRRPGLDSPPYVEVGDKIEPDTVVCVIEAMKVFNEIKAGVSGRLRKLLVEDASPVEFDQPLMLVEPH